MIFPSLGDFLMGVAICIVLLGCAAVYVGLVGESVTQFLLRQHKAKMRALEAERGATAVKRLAEGRSVTHARGTVTTPPDRGAPLAPQFQSRERARGGTGGRHV